MEASDAEPEQKDKNEIEHTEATPIKPVYTYDMKTMECLLNALYKWSGNSSLAGWAYELLGGKV